MFHNLPLFLCPIQPLLLIPLTPPPVLSLLLAFPSPARWFRCTQSVQTCWLFSYTLLSLVSCWLNLLKWCQLKFSNWVVTGQNVQLLLEGVGKGWRPCSHITAAFLESTVTHSSRLVPTGKLYSQKVSRFLNSFKKAIHLFCRISFPLYIILLWKLTSWIERGWGCIASLDSN